MDQPVGAFEGIKYGFRLLLYFLLILIIGGVVAAIGTGIMLAAVASGFGQSNFVLAFVGSIVWILAIAVVYAGFLGTGYKVIADAVYTGNLRASER